MPRQGFLGLDGAPDPFIAAFRVVNALSGAIPQPHGETFADDRSGWQRFLATSDTFQADFGWMSPEAPRPRLRPPGGPTSFVGHVPLSQVRGFARARSRRRTPTDRLVASTSARFLRQQQTVQTWPAPFRLTPPCAPWLIRTRIGPRSGPPFLPPTPWPRPPPIPPHPGPGSPPGSDPGFLRPPQPHPGPNTPASPSLAPSTASPTAKPSSPMPASTSPSTRPAT